MLFAVLLLGALVIVLARNAPDPTTAANATSLGPDNTIPATGSTGVPSPATAGSSSQGSQISSANQLRQSMFYTNAQDASKVDYNIAPSVPWKTRQRGSSGDANYLTDAQSSLMTQDVPPLTKTAMDVPGGMKY